MQQIGTLVPLATHQFIQHPRRVYTAVGGRSDYCHRVMPFHQAYLHQRRVKAPPRASNPLQAVVTGNKNQDSSIRYFKVEMKVHDTELDRYGVVNNAVYSYYIQNGHDKLLESLRISADAITSQGSALALSEVHLKCIAPLRIGDKFVVKVKLGQIKGVRVILEHTIETLLDHKLVLEAKGTIVCLDKDYHPTRIFLELSTKILQFFSSKDD